eukprot:c9316_g1_i1.p1 GENE.c9316_g1_i1~~c9316_g1_i1.p1  ORF type:complete len:123 (-),score=16.54 c9316_g1_i1:53-382(-)
MSVPAAVRVFSHRVVKRGFEKEFAGQIKQLKVAAASARGFIESEHLIQVNALVPNTHVVMSVWRSERDWESWLQSPKRLEWATKLEKIVETHSHHLVLTSEKDTFPLLI